VVIVVPVIACRVTLGGDSGIVVEHAAKNAWVPANAASQIRIRFMYFPRFQCCVNLSRSRFRFLQPGYPWTRPSNDTLLAHLSQLGY
jgi:hypothetical protein